MASKRETIHGVDSLEKSSPLKKQLDLLDNLEWWNIVPHESSDSENDDDEDGICQHANSTPLLISNDLGDVIDETDLLEELRNLSKFQEVAAESENSKSSDDRLFHNSQLSVKESVILLLGFVTRHQLSGVAIEDILSYINLVCPKENNLPKDSKELFSFFEKHSQKIVKHFYCPNKKCQAYVGYGKLDAKQTCGICGCSLKEETMFLEIPVQEQLMSVLSGMELYFS
ncbi:hypothetical protein OS493_038087 [Desmophyllum pertusum]|uniref:Uncharacterized protein n=1 Tax=Desmophyllum pertusum TaxID=174260 RepID=A0A9W9Z622_9CNID|nr:hypothetical protein OS493_038087 [Desmophyllum pertusum]